MEAFANIQTAEVVATVFYTFLGLALFIMSYFIIDWLSPIDLHEEMAEKGNVAVSIVIGSVMISLALLIASIIQS
ncbi:MAG: DUF350 domain-containing protein [Pseudomonadota bacterium]|jgi:uncharacterized membrane protein YjfL (UPF0719 family)